MEEFQRFVLQIGNENFKRLNDAKVLLFGLGGVGGSVAETLARSGVGAITLVDCDCIEISNINRQILALHSTLGKYKVDACAERLVDINPTLNVSKIVEKFSVDSKLNFADFDYIIDAIDDVSAKLEIIRRAKKAGVPVISCMGTGQKFDPLALKIADISKTTVCPLARIIRTQLRKENIENVKCLYSTEQPQQKHGELISSNAFVPNIAGILIAREVIFDLLKDK